MKSKIERLKTDISNIYGEQYGIDHYVELSPSDLDPIALKINEIIDYLNSQSQPEEEELHHHFDDDFNCVRCGTRIGEYWKPCEEKVKDTPEEWVCPKCDFDDCYPYKNSEDFGLMYCPACSELVKLNNKKK